jgi:hypothetical protein
MYTGFSRCHSRLFPVLQKHAGDELGSGRTMPRSLERWCGDELEGAGTGGGQHCVLAGGVGDQGEWTEMAARSARAGGIARRALRSLGRSYACRRRMRGELGPGKRVERAGRGGSCELGGR